MQSNAVCPPPIPPLLQFLSGQSLPDFHLWIIDDVIGRAHTLAARHILLGGLPTSAAELMSIMPTEKSLRRGQQGGILHIQLKESLCQLNERPLEGCLYFSFL